MRRLAATGAFIGRFAVTFSDHPLQGRVKVLLWQVGLAQTHIDHIQTKRLRTRIRTFADLVHQCRAFGRQDGVGCHPLRAQNRTDLTVKNTVQLDFSLTATVGAKGLTELAHAVDAVQHKGIHFETTVIGGGDLDHRRFKRQDTVVVADDFIQQRDFEPDARVFTHLFDLAETQHQRAFTFVHDKDRRQGDNGCDHNHGDEDIEFTHQFDPRLELRSSLSGR